MESVEQVNEEFNEKKHKKKWIKIILIIIALIIIVLALLYFFVFSKPQYVFSRAIDKVLSADLEDYDTVKFDAEARVAIKAEDSNMQQLNEFEKGSLSIGGQLDYTNKKGMANLSLNYDNNEVVNLTAYYIDEEMYVSLGDLFEKYIKVDLSEEQEKTFKEALDTVTSKEERKTGQKVVKIVRDELKSQIKEQGEFDKKQTTIDVTGEEKSVTKSTLILSQKQLIDIISNMCLNLSENDEFLGCFVESPKEELQTIIDELKEIKVNNDNSIKISIYTSGILNEVVGADLEIYSASDETIIISLVKENEDVYSFKISAKTSSLKIDAIKGKIEIRKDKDTESEQEGETLVTAEIENVGAITVTVDYSLEYNNEIDEIDVSNSVSIGNVTQRDSQVIQRKLMERPLIGDLIKSLLGDSSEENGDNITGDEPINDMMFDDPPYITDVPDV